MSLEKLCVPRGQRQSWFGRGTAGTGEVTSVRGPRQDAHGQPPSCGSAARGPCGGCRVGLPWLVGGLGGSMRQSWGDSEVLTLEATPQRLYHGDSWLFRSPLKWSNFFSVSSLKEPPMWQLYIQIRWPS